MRRRHDWLNLRELTERPDEHWLDCFWMCGRFFSTDSAVSSQAGQWHSTREMSSVPPDFKGAWIQALWYLRTKAGGWRSEVQGYLQIPSDLGLGLFEKTEGPWTYFTNGVTKRLEQQAYTRREWQHGRLSCKSMESLIRRLKSTLILSLVIMWAGA